MYDIYYLYTYTAFHINMLIIKLYLITTTFMYKVFIKLDKQ